MSAIREQFDVLAVPIDRGRAARDEPTEEAIAAVQREYSALFDVAGGRPAISLLERRYSDESEQALWEALLAFYTHFGLDFSNGGAAEQPDHVLTELSFMHYLAFLEAGAPRAASDLRRGQRDFLQLHLAAWLPAMAATLAEKAAGSRHSDLATLLVTFVERDVVRLDDCVVGAGPA